MDRFGEQEILLHFLADLFVSIPGYFLEFRQPAVQGCFALYLRTVS